MFLLFHFCFLVIYFRINIKTPTRIYSIHFTNRICRYSSVFLANILWFLFKIYSIPRNFFQVSAFLQIIFQLKRRMLDGLKWIVVLLKQTNELTWFLCKANRFRAQNIKKNTHQKITTKYYKCNIRTIKIDTLELKAYDRKFIGYTAAIGIMYTFRWCLLLTEHRNISLNVVVWMVLATHCAALVRLTRTTELVEFWASLRFSSSIRCVTNESDETIVVQDVRAYRITTLSIAREKRIVFTHTVFFLSAWNCRSRYTILTDFYRITKRKLVLNFTQKQNALNVKSNDPAN